MEFYYENSMENHGTFSENNLVKAIYTAWNVEADLYLKDGIWTIKQKKKLPHNTKIDVSCSLWNLYEKPIR